MKLPTICLPDPSQLQLEDVHVQTDPPQVILTMTTVQPTATCPLCHEVAQRIHSHYGRTVGDLPWAGIPVELRLQVRRFFCRNPSCKRRIFTERLSTVVAPWGRRTQRLTAIQQQIGLVAGGTGGTRLCKTLAIPVSIDTILSQLRKLNLATGATPAVLGVDDWAQRKGHTYGTILVDLERSVVIDLLPDRTPETLAQWLHTHPGIEIISRDRAEAYAEGARNGAPTATQVADRWHLLKNLAEALFKVLQQHHQIIERTLARTQSDVTATIASALSATHAAPETIVSPSEVAPPVAGEVQLTLAGQQRTQRVEQVQQLYQQGWTKRAIAAHLHLDPKTIRRYLNLSCPLLPQRRTRRSILDAFKPYLLARWQTGCHNAAQLFRELQSQNFTGKSSIVRLYLRELRQHLGVPPGALRGQGTMGGRTQPPTLRTLLWSILGKSEAFTDEEQQLINLLMAAHPKLALTIRLAQDFAAMVRQRQVDQLPAWLDRAVQSGSTAFYNFARSLQRDYQAIQAALSLPWSNGPTEGHINRLKCLKRQMYGRAKFDLLRLRLLVT